VANFTVAIPTYNGASRLPKVLAKLEQQTGIENIAWEIIIVDNNSSDDTAKVVQEYQANWSKSMPGVALKYFFEPEQGAAFARLKAVREAQGKWIGFLDDDNLPETDWIAAAYSFAQAHPQAGAIGGQIHGDFEVQPPEGFEKIKQFLAIREHGSEPYIFDAANIRLPPAAALVIRKQAWLESVPDRPRLTGKLPGLLIQGDDYEPLLYIYKNGWEIWYNPAMHTHHQIPHWRLEKDYLLSIARGCGLATYQLRMINAKPGEKPIIFMRTILGNLRRLLEYRLKYRTDVKNQLIPAFEMAFYWGSLMSPFYGIATRIK
jgi:glycosyltransferase involved in cell wall biosynthesis